MSALAMESDELAILIASVIICITGTLANSISLSFFIKKDNGTLVKRTFMMLNVFDLTACITATVYAFQMPLAGSDLYEGVYSGFYFFDVFSVLYWTAVAATAFATTILSVTRTIPLYLPFYRANGRVVAIATLTFVAYILTKEITFPMVKYISGGDEKIMHQHMMYNHCLYAFNIGAPILTVMVSNFMSILKLLRKGEGGLTDITKRATITVIIISVLFCFFNIFSLIGMYWYSVPDTKPLVKLATSVALWIGIPLNSALNPLVYISRKNEMSVYAAEQLRKVLRFFTQYHRHGTRGRVALPQVSSTNV